MLIFDVMERDHSAIKHSLYEIDKYSHDIANNNIFGLLPLLQELKNELHFLNQIEQETIYYEISKIFQNDLTVIRAVEEHCCLAFLIDNCIRNLEKNETIKGFAQFCVAATLINHHFKFEETCIFNLLRETFSLQELEKIGEQYETKTMQQTVTSFENTGCYMVS